MPWYALSDSTPGPYSFTLRRGQLGNDPSVAETLGDFLKFGLAQVDYVEMMARKYGFQAAASYLGERAFAERQSTRIGDFGEIIAGRLLEAEEKLARPVEKARYKDDHNWPVRLTDVFGTKEEGGEITAFVFCEAKAGTTAPRSGLAVTAYSRLIKDMEDERPEVLFFTLERLWMERRFEEHERLDNAMRRRIPVPRVSRMIFVFDADAWRETALEDLEEARVAGEVAELEDFVAYLVTRSELKVLIESAYELAGRKPAA
jgi:hypothetical protein